jgi:hypothetical protein
MGLSVWLRFQQNWNDRLIILPHIAYYADLMRYPTLVNVCCILTDELLHWYQVSLIANGAVGGWF